MSIAVVCSSCGSKLKAPEKLTGRTTKCPKCGKSITVPASASVTPAIATKTVPLPVAAAPTPAAVVPPAADHKDCPFCGEQVLSVAKKCKHCGETLDVALRAAEESRRLVERREQAPMVFMNAGGGAAVSRSAIVDVVPRRSRPSAGTAALLEVLFGLFFATFGIGHIYAGHVGFGLLCMFGGWFVLGVNLALCGLLIGLVTLPMCWLVMLIVSPMIAANSCR